MPQYGHMVHNKEYDIVNPTSVNVNQSPTNINQASQ